MNELQVCEQNSLAIIQKVEIDSAIATAKQYPRSLTDFKATSIAMATLDETTAEECIYRRPVGGGKFAEGMSVRAAEIVAACYGNLKVQSRIIEQTDRFVIAQGVAHDLQANNMVSTEVVESTVDKYGNPYAERMRVVVAKAALAKARRDAIFCVVPKAMARPLETEVRRLLFGDTKSIERRRSDAEKWIKKLGIDEKRVYAALDVAGIDDMTSRHLETLSGLKTALKNDDITIDEAFPELKKKTNGEHDTGQPEPQSLSDIAKKPGKSQLPETETKTQVPETKPPKQDFEIPRVCSNDKCPSYVDISARHPLKGCCENAGITKDLTDYPGQCEEFQQAKPTKLLEWFQQNNKGELISEAKKKAGISMATSDEQKWRVYDAIWE